jgi:tetratricopeptide (TPR) repeat protein
MSDEALAQNNRGFELMSEGNISAAMELWVKASIGGVPNALASYLWYALKQGLHKEAIKLYEICIEDIDFSISPDQKENCESNYALNKVALTGDLREGELIWTENLGSNHLESKFYALMVAVRNKAEKKEVEIASKITALEFKSISKQLLKDELTSSGWFKLWCAEGGDLAQRYLSGAGRVQPMEQSAKDVEVSSAIRENLTTHNTVSQEYASKGAYLKQVQKSKLGQEVLNDKAIVRFLCHHKPQAVTDVELLFTENYVAIITPTTLLLAGTCLILPRSEIKQIQIGTLEHTQFAGVGASTSAFWSVSIVTHKAGVEKAPLSFKEAFKAGKDGAKANIVDGEIRCFLPLGKTQFQAQEYSNLYDQKLTYLSSFYPVNADGGHMQSSAGFRASVGVGFWREID